MNDLFRQERLRALLDLSHELGREDRHMAILGEGNVSARLSKETFLVKASGSQLGNLTEEGVVECRSALLLPLMEEEVLSDATVDEALFSSRVDPTALKPSVESIFHAWLLSLPDIEFVGHTHAVAVNQILCSPRARDFAERRLFPDEIVCCGPASVFVPSTDPGLKLAQAIMRETKNFLQKYQRAPRVILLENHGIIAPASSGASVLATMLMAEKAASIFLGAASLGGPVFLREDQVNCISGRPDEHYRQRILNL